jgi:Sec-independent protein translocase protein TatA
MFTDLVVVLFVAILVVGGLHVPRIGDALGRLLRRDRDGS